MRARLKGEKRLKVRLLIGLIKLRRTSQKSIFTFKVRSSSTKKEKEKERLGVETPTERCEAARLRRRGVQKRKIRLSPVVSLIRTYESVLRLIDKDILTCPKDYPY